MWLIDVIELVIFFQVVQHLDVEVGLEPSATNPRFLSGEVVVPHPW